jgi:mycofactocin precursor
MAEPTGAERNQPRWRDQDTVEADPVAEEALVEEVSIDGMCGVY